MNRLPRLMAITLMAIMFTSACGGAPATSQSVDSAPSSSTYRAPAAPTAAPAPTSAAAAPIDSSAMPASASGEASNAAPAPAVVTNPDGFDRMVIKDATLTMQVESVTSTDRDLRAFIVGQGGYIVRGESTGTADQLTIQTSYRIPNDRFETILDHVQGMASYVVGRTISGDDVSAEYIDLQSRLKTLEDTRKKLTEFQAGVTTVDDTLRMHRTINEIQAEIDQIQGRMNYLSRSSAMSLLTVILMPVPRPEATPVAPTPVPVVDPVDTWAPDKVARGELRSLIGVGQSIANFMIVMGIWSPIWLPLLLISFWIFRRLYRHSNEFTSKTTPLEHENPA